MKETYVNPMLQMLLQMEANAFADGGHNRFAYKWSSARQRTSAAFGFGLVHCNKNISDYNDLLLIVVLFARYNV